jgi:hypothetical protein
VTGTVALVRITRGAFHRAGVEQWHELTTDRRRGDQEHGGEPSQGQGPGEHD